MPHRHDRSCGHHKNSFESCAGCLGNVLAIGFLVIVILYWAGTR